MCALSIRKGFFMKSIAIASLFPYCLFLYADLMGGVYFPSWLRSQAGDQSLSR